MKSAIKEALEIEHEPVAIVLSDEKPSNAKQFKEKRWGCIMFMLVAAIKGQTAAFDRNTYGCQGGGTGLGFGNQYKNFPGGEACFCYFLSIGNEQWAAGRQAGEQVKPYMREDAFDDFMQGERYIKSPELVKKFIEDLPIVDIPFKYVVFKPLKDVDKNREKPEVVVFLGDMDQISGLTILANYHRETNDNVIFPFAAGCQSMGIYAFAEAKSDKPRAVLGLNDISARLAIKRLLKKDLMSFAAPYKLFEEMEANLPGSFVERNTWYQLRALK